MSHPRHALSCARDARSNSRTGDQRQRCTACCRRRKTLLWYHAAPRENGTDGVSLSRGSHAEAAYLERRSARGRTLAGARAVARSQVPVRSYARRCSCGRTSLSCGPLPCECVEGGKSCGSRARMDGTCMRQGRRRISPSRERASRCAYKGIANRNRGTDNRNRGTDNRNRCTDNRNRGTDNRDRYM